MIPLRVNEQVSIAPLANRTLVAANIGFFIVQMASGDRAGQIVRAFGFIPARLSAGQFDHTTFHALLTLLTSLFLHGGFVHIAGNLIYLSVFGSSVEQRLGTRTYLALYLSCGVAGSLAHGLVFPSSEVPSIGASGAIAGVLGAFLVLSARARVVTLFPLVISWAMAEIPALVFLPVWFGLQFLSGWFVLASASSAQEAGGVAWWAHVGGFLVGAGFAAGWRRRLQRGTCAVANPSPGTHPDRSPSPREEGQ